METISNRETSTICDHSKKEAVDESEELTF